MAMLVRVCTQHMRMRGGGEDHATVVAVCEQGAGTASDLHVWVWHQCCMRGGGAVRVWHQCCMRGGGGRWQVVPRRPSCCSDGWGNEPTSALLANVVRRALKQGWPAAAAARSAVWGLCKVVLCCLSACARGLYERQCALSGW
jgi:hypothetical protein